MTKVLYFKGRVLLEGRAKGEALVSRRAFTFAHGVEPSTGVVTDIRSDLLGESVREKVLFFPFGKGSTTGAAWFLETVRVGNAPAVAQRATAEGAFAPYPPSIDRIMPNGGHACALPTLPPRHCEPTGRANAAR